MKKLANEIFFTTIVGGLFYATYLMCFDVSSFNWYIDRAANCARDIYMSLQ